MRNIGNTCFISAVMWAVRHCPRARRALASSDHPLCARINDVFENPRNSSSWPGLVKDVGALIGRTGREQHDSHEVLCAIMDKIGGGFEKLFTVQLHTSIKCVACGQTAKIVESNVYIACEPGDTTHHSIAVGLAAAHAPKRVHKRQCDFCRRTADGIMRTVPKTPAPHILVVRSSSPRIRVEHKLNYCGCKYRLRAIIVHRGSANFGHYTTLLFDDNIDKWVLCDDDSVSQVNVKTENGGSEIDGAAIVMYEKQ